jgi:hypothetical protein
MRIFVKSFLSLAVAGLLFATAQVGAAESSKAGTSDQLNMCIEGCKSSKDNLAYEGCVIQCQKDHKKTNKSEPPLPAKKNK